MTGYLHVIYWLNDSNSNIKGGMWVKCCLASAMHTHTHTHTQHKPNESAKWNMLLKDMNVSFQINPQTSRTPNIWARMNLGNMKPPFLQPCLFHLELGNENAVDQWDKACSWKLWWLAFIPTTCTPSPHPHALLTSDWQIKTQLICEMKYVLETYDGQLLNESLNIKAPKNWARNEPIHLIFLLHLPWLFWSWISKWKPLQLAKQSRHLKGPIISFQANSWYSDSTVIYSWWQMCQ